MSYNPFDPSAIAPSPRRRSVARRPSVSSNPFSPLVESPESQPITTPRRESNPFVVQPVAPVATPFFETNATSPQSTTINADVVGSTHRVKVIDLDREYNHDCDEEQVDGDDSDDADTFPRELESTSKPARQCNSDPNFLEYDESITVRDGDLSEDQALQLAKDKEEQECVPALPNEEQIYLMSKVKEGSLTQAEALNAARENALPTFLDMNPRVTKTSSNEDVLNPSKFNGILHNILSINEQLPRTDSGDSLKEDIRHASEVLDNPSLLEHLHAPI
eukprot:gene9294-1563_t